MKRSPLAARSAKTRRAATSRASCVAKVLARDRTCRGRALWPEVACWGALQVHEPLSRARGGDPGDPDRCVAVCAAHHRAIHDQPALADERGLLIHSWVVQKGSGTE